MITSRVFPFPASRVSRIAALAITLIASVTCARAEHGRFDRTTPDPREESLIFTPAGFGQPGQPVVATGPDVATLNVTIVDAGTRQATPCRVNVVGADGNFYQPRDNPLGKYNLNGTWPDTLAGNRPGKAPIRYFGYFFYTRGQFQVIVPAGPVRIEVSKGFEYRVETLSTHAAAGTSRDLRVELTRAVPMAEQGWHSGDPHLHFARTGDADDETIFDLLEAEDIRLGMILCYNDDTSNYVGLMPELATPQLRGLGAKSVRRRGPYQIISGQEYRNGVLGHLNLFLRDRLVLDGTRVDPNIGPLFGRIGEETRAQGGYAFHAHGGYGLEIWADLVHRATSGVELLQFGIYRGIGLDGWYHALNAGFRFPGVAACDYPACRKLGDCRTYVHLDGEPTFEAWLKAAAEGRSFMTTAPVVLLTVEGHKPGDTITTADTQPRRVRAHVRVRSETAPVTNVQLLADGRVVRELVVPPTVGTGQWLELDETVEMVESGWLAARAFSKSVTGAADAEAHTNPVYVHLAGKPPCRAADVDWLIERVDEQLEDHQARAVPEKQVVIDYFRRAREILVDLKSHPPVGTVGSLNSTSVATQETIAAPRPAVDVSMIEKALAQPLLAAGTPLAEMRAYCVPRIPTLPTFKDRGGWEQYARETRQRILDQVVFRGAARQWRDATTRVEWLDTIAGGPGYTIRKFRYEALPGMWIPGLLYAPERLSGRVPLALSLNGHTKEGKATDYKQLLSINLAKRGMLVLDLEWFGMGQLATPGFSHYRLNQIDLCGASGLAPFYLALSRALDLGLALEHADPARVLVTGLSGGGWQTIVISALDERVTLANPVAGYGGLRSNILSDDMGDSEQAPADLGRVADYTHLTALRAPRPTLLTYNATDDCCFRPGHALEPLLAAAQPAFALCGAEDKLRWHVNHEPGTHNFEEENREKLYAAIGDFFYPGDATFGRRELPSRDELKTAEQLHVPLPAENVDFHRLAQTLHAGLLVPAAPPTNQPAATKWQDQKRVDLKLLLRIPNYQATRSDDQGSSVPGCRIVSRLIRCGDAWTVPCVECSPVGSPTRKTALVVSDAGRGGEAAQVARLVSEGYRVLVVDPLFLGESTVKAQDPAFLYPLFMSALGERPLGIQAGQLTAIARFAHSAHDDQTPTVFAHGLRASMAALVAAVVEPTAIHAAELTGSLATLKQLIDDDKTVEQLPELFAFGLLPEFDIPTLVAIAGRDRIAFRPAEPPTPKKPSP